MPCIPAGEGSETTALQNDKATAVIQGSGVAASQHTVPQGQEKAQAAKQTAQEEAYDKKAEAQNVKASAQAKATTQAKTK